MAGVPSDDLVPSLLTLSDVMGTGWHAAVAAQLGAGRIVAMSRHESRQQIARAFGATDVVEARGDDAVAAVRELTDGVGADAVLECVGTGEAMTTAIWAARPGATVGYVGVPHGVELPVRSMFSRNVGVAGGSAPVRAYLPMLRDLVLARDIDPRAWSSTSRCRSRKRPRRTPRWTSGARSSR